MLKKTVLTFAFLTILTTFYGFNAKFSTPVTDDMLNEEADFGNSLLSDGDYVISVIRSPAVERSMNSEPQAMILPSSVAVVSVGSQVPVGAPVPEATR